MAQAQLYLWSGARKLHLEVHDFYVEQMASRVLAQFNDIEGDAQRHSDEVYEQIGRLGYDESYTEMGVEAALDAGYGFFSSLSDLRRQVILGGLAGLYHQFDKTVRQHLERELRHNLRPDKMVAEIWRPNLVKLLEVFGEFGWPVKALAFHEKIKALHLVINVYKHGKGQSLDELARDHCAYLYDPIADLTGIKFESEPDYGALRVSDEQFMEFADAIREFWVAMPERLHCEIPERTGDAG